MGHTWYRGAGGAMREAPAEDIPVIRGDEIRHPSRYLADPGLVDAVNVSLSLAQPLLVTGEPGTGKTQLAYSIAWDLGFDEPLRFETKSTSTARDLFYSYDALGRFHAAQSGGGNTDPGRFIRLNALGLAILLASADGGFPALADQRPTARKSRRSVVLIDEIDKAPRDFPNDLLHEIESASFGVPELGTHRVTAADSNRPIVVITSNSEKHLPDAFLRRCIYYHIPFPDSDRLERIVVTRLGDRLTTNQQVVNDAMELFDRLRHPTVGLAKKPSTSELLDWLRVIPKIYPGPGNPLRDAPESLASTLAALVKTTEDRERARGVIEEWTRSKR